MQTEESEEDGFIVLSRINQAPTHAMQHDVPKYMSSINAYVDSLRDILWPLNEFIHRNPELAFTEYKAHDALTAFMQLQKGWKITPHAYGIETAWTAIFDSGKNGPVISFNAEMGMLKSITPLAKQDISLTQR